MSFERGLPATMERKLISGIHRAKSDIYLRARTSKFIKARSEESLLGKKPRVKKQPKEIVDRRNFDWGALSNSNQCSSTRWDKKIDSTVPNPLLSPLGKKVLLRNTFRHAKLEPECFLSCQEELIKNEPDIRDFEPPFVEESPELSSRTSTATLAGSAGDLRAVILARIPSHVKEHLSLDEWNRILEPLGPRNNGAAAYDCSDILHEEDIESSQIPRIVPLVNSDKVYDALYCTENGSKNGSGIHRKPKIEQEFKMERKPSVVSFGTVHVRWYERILVVHPCTSSGPSLGIGWEYTESSPESIDGFRHPGSDDIRLSRDFRERIVKDLGYSTRDVAYAVRESLRIKNQRRRTINNLKANVVNIEKVECMVENCNRKLRTLQTTYLSARASRELLKGDICV